MEKLTFVTEDQESVDFYIIEKQESMVSIIF